MGIAYGAGGLWQWRLHAQEPGHAAFFLAEDTGWREALDFEGSRYVGLIPRILEGLPLTDMEPNWQVTLGRRGLLVPHKLYIGYLSEGGVTMFFGDQAPLHYRIVDPRTGEVIREGERPTGDGAIVDTGHGPRVIICFAG